MKKRIACLMLALVMLIGLIPGAAVSASAAGMSVSEAGIRVIKNYMGFQKNAYETYTGSGVYKIGYGTPSVKGATITEANADKLLREELAKLEETVNANFSNLVQKRVDALIWYSYVEGTGWTGSSVFKSAVQNNVSASALADAMCTWDYDASGFPDDAAARSVITRRMAMANLYLNGGYSATATGSLNYTVFYAGADEGATFPNGAKKMVQVFSGSFNEIKISDASAPALTGAKFLGWYSDNTLVTGVGASTAGKTLTAHWQKSDDQVSASYTLPAYVIYEARSLGDNETVTVHESPDATSKKIDVVERESTVTVVAEKIVGSQKWIQLSTGGWVELCNSINNMPTILPATTVTITDDYVNIRKEPNANSAKLGTLKRGEQVTIVMVSTDDNWGYCSKGWIFLAYTSYAGTSSSTGSSLTGGTTGYVTGASKVNVRSGAGVNNALVTQLSEGTAITVYEQTTVGNAAWGHIDQGWISMNYVKLNETTQAGSNITTGSSAVVSSSVSLNVRSGPGTSYTKVATLAPGTSVVILRKETVGGVAWGLIDQGWINLNYVTTTASSTGSGSTYGVGGTVVNCATGVNIRSAAGTTNALVGVAALGTRVTVTERVMVNGFYWGHIDRGWVCMDYIQLDSEFIDPSTEVDNELDNVVTSFQGYPAVTNVATNLLDSASAHANTVLTLNASVELNILARAAAGSNIYGKVTIGNKTGWVNLKDVTLKQVNAKVTATKADAYELPNTRSQFYASLDKGTYVTIGNADGTGWELSDGVLWGQVSITGHNAWIKLADVTMFKGNITPVGITTLSGVGYLTGTLTGGAVVYKEDEYGNISTDASIYTLPAGSNVNVQARNYVSGKTWAKITVGSVTGWIDWDLIALDPVTYEASTTVNPWTASALGTTVLTTGQRVTILSRELYDYSIVEINHGLIDLGYGYIGDNTADTIKVVLDDGKMTPITNATGNDASNPAVSASVVVTGTATGNVNVYEEAIDGSNVLLTIQSGSNVTVLNWMNVNGVTWGKVQVNKIVGWVKTSELSFAGLKGKVKGDSLKVYSMQDKSWPVQVLRSNTAAFELNNVEFDGSTLWAWIQVGSTIGFVDLSEVTLSTPGMTTDPEYLTTIAKGKVNGVNATVNVTDGSIQTLPKGTEVELAGIDMMSVPGTARWQIKLGSNAGWINMDYLTMYNSIATITEASAPIYNDLALVEADVLYTLYRGEKITVLSYMVRGEDGKLYGEVAYGNTTGWILLCDASNKMYVSLVPGSTGTTIGGTTSSGTVTTPTEPTETTPTTTDAYIVCSTTVNVRSAAGVDKPLVTTLANGTNVKIYEQTTVNNVAWARIDQGWVCMDYVRIGTLVNVPAGGTTGSSGTVAIVTTVPSGAIAIGYANQDIKVRSGSGLGYAEVATISKNTNVVIYEIKLDGGMSWGRTDNGWVCVSYLTITGIGAAGSGTTGNISGVGFTANVRGTANSNGALMAKVMITSPVVVRETTTVGAETWVRTDLGWILSQYVAGISNGTTTDSTVSGTTTPTDPTASGSEMDFVG